MPTKSCRRALAGAVLAAAVAASAGAARAADLTIGHTTWVGYGPMFLARDLGYYKEEGIEVDLPTVDDNAIAEAAAAAGQMDGSASTIDEILKYRSPDNCFKTVAALDDSHGGDGIVVESGIGGLPDLKGRQVAMNEGSTSQFWFAYLMKQQGMAMADVTVLNMTADDAAAAFIAKRVPAAVTWEPNLTFVKTHEAGKVLVDSAATPGIIVDVVALNCSTIEKKPKAVAGFVKALFRAVDYLEREPEKAYAIMAPSVGGYLAKPEDFAAAAKGVNFYGRSRNLAYIGTAAQPGGIAETIKLGAEIWGAMNELKMPVDYPTMVDPSFVNP